MFWQCMQFGFVSFLGQQVLGTGMCYMCQLRVRSSAIYQWSAAIFSVCMWLQNGWLIFVVSVVAKLISFLMILMSGLSRNALEESSKIDYDDWILVGATDELQPLKDERKGIHHLLSY